MTEQRLRATSENSRKATALIREARMSDGKHTAMKRV
jgi:hypothetical protein